MKQYHILRKSIRYSDQIRIGLVLVAWGLSACGGSLPPIESETSSAQSQENEKPNDEANDPAKSALHESRESTSENKSDSTSDSPGQGDTQITRSPIAHPISAVPSVVLPQVEVKVPAQLQPEPISAQRLGVRVLAQDTSPDHPHAPVPRALAERSALDDFGGDHSKLVLNTKLFLPDALSPNPNKRVEQYFVWPEDSLGSKIVSATFSHRIKTVQGSWIGNLDSRLVSHDPAHRRWFISISDIFKNRADYTAGDIQLEDTQVLSIHFTLEDGRHGVIELEFQACGPLPSVQISDQGVGLANSALTLIRGTATEGWVVQRDMLVNPVNRLFHVWVRFNHSENALNLNTYPQVTKYEGRADDRPLGPIIELKRSSGALVVSHLNLVRPGVASERVGLTNGRWAKFTMLPGEWVQVNWVARPADRVPYCSLPVDQIVSFNWATRLNNWWTPHFVNLPMTWSFAGGSIKGDWDREVRMVHPFISEAVATQNRIDGVTSEHATLTQGTVNVNYESGIMAPNATPFPCQGVFPF